MVDGEPLRMNDANIDSQDLAIDLFERGIENGLSRRDAARAAIEAYPEHVQLIADYALTEFALDAEEASPAADALAERIERRGRDLIAAKLSPALLPGILAAARARGLTAPALSQSLGLARSVIVKLDRRLIEPSTIPAAALARIGQALGCAASDLRAYLDSPPTLATGASYRSRQAPELAANPDGRARREPFDAALVAAVRSGEMNPADADGWSKGER